MPIPSAACPLGHTTKPELAFQKGNNYFWDCPDCRLRFLNPVPTAEELSRFYKKDYFEGGGNGAAYQNYESTASFKIRTFQERLFALEKAVGKKGILLDIGCGAGFFVAYALKSGWSSYGMDLSAYAVENANARSPGRCFTPAEGSAHFKNGSFDAITLLDCLEHVRNPIEFLLSYLPFLRPGGFLLIESPNLDGLMSRLMGSQWPYYRPPEHLIHYGPKTLQTILSRVDCRLTEWHMSFKHMSLPYIAEQLSLNNPVLGRIFGWLASCAGPLTLKLPTGSFWALAKKNL